MPARASPSIAGEFGAGAGASAAPPTTMEESFTLSFAAGYNVGMLLRWLAELLRVIIRAFVETIPAQNIA
jgi:hypothetical protein